ncbi:MAG: sigma 54-interacting transcriptional regulator [Candidatus Thiodiazotropha endolucinida]
MELKPEICLKYESVITFKTDEATQYCTSIEFTKFPGMDDLDKKSEDIQRRFADDKKGDDDCVTKLNKPVPLPPYVRSQVLQAIGGEQIDRKLKVDIVFVQLGNDENSDPLLVAYDCTETPRGPIGSAKYALVNSESGGNNINPKAELKAFVNCFFGENTKIPQYFERTARIHHEIQLLSYKVEGNKTVSSTVSIMTTWYRHHAGEFALVLPISRFPRAGEMAKHAVVVGSYSLEDTPSASLSTPVWENLDSLQNALTCSGSKTTLIRGQPGSGKEVYAHALHYGSGKPKDAKFKMRAVAGMEHDTLRQTLFGRSIDGVIIPGLISEAEGGSLFLDEFDKVHEDADGFYSELLRVLEADEYVPLYGRQAEKVTKVDWILAGAFTSMRTVEALPPDFWSRLTHEINLKNPLQERGSDEYTSTLFCYFFFSFIIKKAEELLESDSADVFQFLKTPLSYESKSLHRLLFADRSPNEDDPWIPCNELRELAKRIAMYTKKYVVCRREEKQMDKDKLGSVVRHTRPVFASILTNEKKKFGQMMAAAWQSENEGVANDYKPSKDDWYKLIKEGQQSIILNPEDKFDSIRGIRQAARVSFDKLYERAIAFGEGFKWSDNIKNALSAAIVTLDVTRPGVKADEVLMKNQNYNEEYHDQLTKHFIESADIGGGKSD